MKLGILVSTDKHLGHLVGITKAATAQGHEVVIFIMDDGTRLLEKNLFVELSAIEGVSVSACEHSTKEHDVNTESLPEKIVLGSQFNNAMMNHHADRVIVL